MAIIDQAEVQPYLTAYLNHGIPAHFELSNNQKIHGYIFDRTEFLSLIRPYKTNHLYIKLGLTSGPNPHITPIIGRIIDGEIDPSRLVMCKNINTSILTGGFPEIMPIIPDKLTDSGHPISREDANRIVGYHISGNQELGLRFPVSASHGDKIIGFNLFNTNLEYIFNNDNDGDFFLAPALKDLNFDRTPVTIRHLTLIASWIKNDTVHIPSLFDYLLPCPPAGGCKEFASS